MTALRKTTLLAAAFIVAAIIGVLVLSLATFVLVKLQLVADQATHPGIGAVAGGISESVLTGVPVLFGIIGVLIALRRLEKRNKLEKRNP